MSDKYRFGDVVPSETICKRLKELSYAVSGGRESILREFDMRVPAEMDRDADLVLAKAAKRIEELESQRKWYSFEIHQPEVNTPYLVRIQHDITYSYDVDILVETDDRFMWVKNSNKIVTHWSHITPPEGE